MNPYGYVHCPTVWVDPFGLAGCCLGLTVSINWKGFNPQKRDYQIDGVTHNNLSGLQYHYPATLDIACLSMLITLLLNMIRVLMRSLSVMLVKEKCGLII